MKKLNVILIFLFLIATTIFGQNNKINPNDTTLLLDLKSEMTISVFNTLNWELYSKYHQQEYAPIIYQSIPSFIDTFLIKKPLENKRIGQLYEYKLVKKYENNLKKLFLDFRLIGSDEIGSFIITKKLPCSFNYYKDSSIVLCLSSLYIDKIYNTIRMSSRQRATSVITAYLLTSLKYFSNNFSNIKNIDYYCISCVYGSKDFTNERSLKSEIVFLVVPVELAKKYANLEITEDEIIESSDIFLNDRTMASGIKKVKIKLE